MGAEGPFSSYPGLTRIVTVVQGAGMELVTPDGVLEALFMRPVRFAGALPVQGRLPNGPIRDLNLMLRDGCFRGEVARLGVLPTDNAALRMLHVASGSLRLGGETAGAGATVIAPQERVEAQEGADVLDIRIMPEG